jgi:ABC-type transport system involved in cytochrome c biogenesis permease subunit
MMTPVLIILQSFALLACFLGIFLAVLNIRHPSEALKRGSAAALVAAWLLQTAGIASQGIEIGGVPLRNGVEFLLVLSWGVLTLHLVIWFKSRIQAAALVLPPISFVAAALAVVVHAPRVNLPEGQMRGWLLFHTAAATLGLAVLSVAFAMALIYLVQEHALKAKRSLAILEKLPSLETCDRVGFHALVWGFALLSVGIFTGLVRNMTEHQAYWMGGPKQTFPVLAWFVFALLFYARFMRGLRGRKSAYLTITGFALGLMTILGLVR